MPQVAAHLVVADRIHSRLAHPGAVDAFPEEFNLGSIAPDLALFLFDPVGQSDALNSAIEVMRVIHDVADTLSDIRDAAMGPVDDFIDWVTGGLSTSVINLISRAFSALQATIALAVVPGGWVTVPNPFAGMNVPGVPNGSTITVYSSDLSVILRQFGHPYTNDPGYKTSEAPGDYKNWWWVDLLHYRRTGLFAQTLTQQAAGHPELESFAAGYWTHIAADVCGHPYVNGVVGGPFRNHVMRHMVLESIMDTWIWQHYEGGDITEAKLHKRVGVGDFEHYAELLINTMKTVFTEPAPPHVPILPARYPDHVPRVDDLVRAYQTMLMYLELSTDSMVQPPIPPPSNPQEFFNEIGSSIANTAGNIAEAFSGNREWWEWLLAPFLAAAYALVLLFKLLTLPAEVLTRAISLAPRWYAYMLELTLYNFIREARWSLTLGGWGRPSVQDLVRPFATSGYVLPPSRTGSGAFEYPFRAISHNQFGFWLLDPFLARASVETPNAECCPYIKGSTPSVFIDGPGYDIAKDGQLRDMGLPLPTPSATVDLEWQTFSGPQFGNAVEFGVKLIEGDYPPVSFDLDGDRGYGYQSWESPVSSPVYRDDLIN